MANKQDDNSIIFAAKVLQTDDPMMLGRIRAVRTIDNLDDILRNVTDPPWNPEKDPWTSRDPLVFGSLLPYFVYSTPKKDELVQVMYLNKDFRFQNQFYIQGSAFSSPTATFKEFYVGGNKFTGNGSQQTDPKPLKNQDGTFTDQAIHAGVFPEPGDNAILGRGSADVVVKQDEVLIRAGKFKDSYLQPNIVPVANPKRAFLQLSRFQSYKKPLPPDVYYELDQKVFLIKNLIEWTITNPENTKNNFIGSVYLYQLKPSPSTNSENLTVGSKIEENLKTLIFERELKGTSDEVIGQINTFIKACNDTNTFEGHQLFADNQGSTKFPMFYRPTNLVYDKINPSALTGTTSSTEVNNLLKIYKGIRITPAIKGGYSLIYSKNNLSSPATPKKVIVEKSTYTQQQVTYAALGGDKVFILSSNSAIPGRGGPINFDNTLYGISGDTFTDAILPKTSSMVRGEELLELINLIVRFLVTHTHAYPGLPPVPVTQDGTSTQSLLSELQNAVNKILNGNIRLN